MFKDLKFIELYGVSLIFSSLDWNYIQNDIRKWRFSLELKDTNRLT